jgi:hypothetical protein
VQRADRQQVVMRRSLGVVVVEQAYRGGVRVNVRDRCPKVADRLV